MSMFTFRRQSDQSPRVRRIAISMSTALPNTGVPTPPELHLQVERWIDGYLAEDSADDGCGHILDTWLRTREADAQAALQELIDQQRQVDDALVGKARRKADRTEQRHRRVRERSGRYRGAAERIRCGILDEVPAGPVAAEPVSKPAVAV